MSRALAKHSGECVTRWLRDCDTVKCHHGDIIFSRGYDIALWYHSNTIWWHENYTACVCEGRLTVRSL